MKNKTKKVVKILLAVLLIVVLQTMGYTYAKYITQEKGSGQAEVAKWAFQIVKQGEEAKTVNLAETTKKETLVNGKIAPGTVGAINIGLDGTGSEVDLEYELKFANEKNKPQNLIFTYNGKAYKSLSEITDIKGIMKHNASSKTENLTIYWRWQYETGGTEDEILANDIIDTQDANKITGYTFDIIATATQCE